MTWLSNAWNDSDPDHHDPDHHVDTVNRDRWANGTNTEVNAAILAGHSPSPCDHHTSVNNGNCSGSTYFDYGGGLENFPRFLEDWRPRTMTYVGSLVSLYYNQQGNGQWKFLGGSGSGQYYWPPTRNWSFDMRFMFPDQLPPGTPVVGNVIHTAFRPVY